MNKEEDCVEIVKCIISMVFKTIKVSFIGD